MMDKKGRMLRYSYLPYYITKFNLTKLHHKNGNFLVLLHYLTTPIAIGYNQNGTTGFQKSLI